MKGKFITFEGSEGSGKSTQSKLLYQYLRKQRYPVVYAREPGATKIGEKLRNLLLDAGQASISAECETLLYMAARAQIVDEIIKPALKQSKIVICDRFLDSTVAYQGYGLGIDIKAIRSIGDFATGGIKPDLTFFLDLPVEQGLNNRKGAMDRIERRSYQYHCRVRKGYLVLAGQQPARVRVVKVQKTKGMTQQAIRDMVERFLVKARYVV